MHSDHLSKNTSKTKEKDHTMRKQIKNSIKLQVKGDVMKTDTNNENTTGKSNDLQYYTVVYSYDDHGATWLGTGILADSPEQAMLQFRNFTSVKRFHIVCMKFSS